MDEPDPDGRATGTLEMEFWFMAEASIMAESDLATAVPRDFFAIAFGSGIKDLSAFAVDSEMGRVFLKTSSAAGAGEDFAGKISGVIRPVFGAAAKFAVSGRSGFVSPGTPAEKSTGATGTAAAGSRSPISPSTFGAGWTGAFG